MSSDVPSTRPPTASRRTCRSASRPGRRRQAEAEQVTDDEDLRVAGQGEVGQRLDPAGAVDLGTVRSATRSPSGLAWTPAAQIFGAPPRSGGGHRPNSSTSRPVLSMPRPSRPAGRRSRAAPAVAFVLRASRSAKLGTRAARRPAGRSWRRPDRCAGVALERAVRELEIWPAISTPVGPAPTITNVISRSPDDGVVLEFGELEGGRRSGRAARARCRCSSSRPELGDASCPK